MVEVLQVWQLFGKFYSFVPVDRFQVDEVISAVNLFSARLVGTTLNTSPTLYLASPLRVCALHFYYL